MVACSVAAMSASAFSCWSGGSGLICDFSGDGGDALRATLNGPKHLCVDRDGSVLIAARSDTTAWARNLLADPACRVDNAQARSFQ